MGTIINKYQSDIYAYYLKELRNPFIAEEVASETCYRFWINYTDTKTEQEAKTLLYNIAKNIIIDSSRRRIVQDKYLRSVTTVQASDEDIIHNQIFLEMILSNCEKGIIDLNPCEMKILEVLWKKKVNPKSNEEIAKETGLGIANVESSKKTLFRKIRSFYSLEDDKY